MDYPAFFVAFSLGVLGGAHCIGMCGGIIGALSMAVKPDDYIQKLKLILFYNTGRITSYLLVAVLFYTLITFADAYVSLKVLRALSGLLLIAMGLYLARWWQGITILEKLGGYLWRYLQPLSKHLLPVKNASQALLLGMLWGWLPCGLIYSALVYSATATSLPNAILTMFFFALGTLPAVVTTGIMAERLTQLVKNRPLRLSFSLLIIVYGVWVFMGALSH